MATMQRKQQKKIPFMVIICVIGIIMLVAVVYQRNYFSTNKRPKEKVISLGNGVTMEFVLMERGSFFMGSYEEEGDEDETPRHKVRITKPFYMAKYEVTQEQWQAVMGNNPSKFIGENNPVDFVSWNDCVSFTKKVSETTGEKVGLPSEAQWEYACRAKTTTKWFYGESEEEAGKYGFIEENAKASTHPVGQKKPNEWGLYDMYGNVQEWCLDWYENPYSNKQGINPTGPSSGDSKVIRGGGWGDFPDNARSAYRNANGIKVANDGTGFRCIMEIN